MRTRRTLPAFILAALLLLLPLTATPAEAGRGHRSHVSVHISPFWWGWGGFWGGYYGPYYGGYYYPHYGYPRTALTTRDVGAVDLNVQPKKADVYVDGELAGNAGRFDGFPGYLWLDEGEHQLVLVHDGFSTITKVIEVRRGSLTDLRVEMAPGESRPASEFFVRQPPRVRERSPEEPYGDREPEPYSDRERRRVTEPERREYSAEEPTATAEESLDARVESARLSLEITPEDASVYLDGRFLGTVAELDRLHAGILVDAGEHTLNAVRPGYTEASLDFEAVSGEELVLKVDLDPE